MFPLNISQIKQLIAMYLNDESLANYLIKAVNVAISDTQESRESWKKAAKILIIAYRKDPEIFDKIQLAIIRLNNLIEAIKEHEQQKQGGLQ